MTKHYVCFFYPGSFWPEESIKQIESRNSKFNIPKRCFAYSFFDREEIEKDGELLIGNRKNVSKRTYIGEVFTIDEVRAKFPDSKTLISNMEINRWNRIVRTRMGNFQPFDDGDLLISEQELAQRQRSVATGDPQRVEP